MKLDPYTLRKVAAEYRRRYRAHVKQGWGAEFERQQAEYWKFRAELLEKKRKSK